MSEEVEKFRKRIRDDTEQGYFSVTIRFSKRDYERMQKLIESGEYVTISEIVRKAVREFLEKEGVV